MTLREWMRDRALTAAADEADHERFVEAFEETIEPVFSDPGLNAEATEELKEKHRGEVETIAQAAREAMQNLNEGLSNADPEMRDETAWFLAQKMKKTDLSDVQEM